MAPPPSLALTAPDISCGSIVNVTVGVSVAGNVIESVSGTGLDAFVAMSVGVDVVVDVAVVVVVVVVVIVTVPLVGVTEFVNEMVGGVLEGSGLLVVVAVRLGVRVRDGSAVGSLVSVDVGTAASVFCGGSPNPINMTRIPAKSRSEIPLKKIPWVVGRSFKAKRVNKPRTLANAKWTAKTWIPCGHIPGTPEPRPNPPALIGK